MKLIAHPNIGDESAFIPTVFKLESEAMNKGELL